MIKPLKYIGGPTKTEKIVEDLVDKINQIIKVVNKPEEQMCPAICYYSIIAQNEEERERLDNMAKKHLSKACTCHPEPERCENCEIHKPGWVISVDNAEDPHCSACGREIVKSYAHIKEAAKKPSAISKQRVREIVEEHLSTENPYVKKFLSAIEKE